MEILAYLVISALIIALTSKPVQQDPAVAQEVDVTVVEIGKPVPVLFGDMWIEESNLVWYGDTRTAEIMSEGGKK